MWDERYSTDDYVFGTDPSDFLRSHVDYLTPGKTALAVADGEGRNSVFMAQQGMHVTAMDGSAPAIAKARKLAADRGVEIAFHQGDITTWDWDAAPYDLVVGIFFQFLDPAARARVFDGLKRAVKPGGVLMIHGYRPEQVAFGTGGPPNPDFMYDAALLRAAFGDFEILHLDGYDREIHEGAGHSGMSALIDLIARRPA